MNQLSATLPANQWSASALHETIDEAANVLANHGAAIGSGSTDIKTHKDYILQGMVKLLPAGNA